MAFLIYLQIKVVHISITYVAIANFDV